MLRIRRIFAGVVLLSLIGGIVWWNWRDAAAGAGQVKVRFWNGFTGPDGRTMLRLVKRFNRENPDVHVQMQRMDWSTYYNKLFVAGMGGRAPEVFVIHTSGLPRFSRAEFLRSVDDLVTREGSVDVTLFDEGCWRGAEFNGRHVGVPLDVHPQGLYYNRKLFREAGIVDENGRAKPPTNRAEFLDAAKRLTKDLDGDGKIDQWGFAFTNLRNNFLTLMPQFGGRYFTDDFSRCTLTEAPNVAALQFGVDLIHQLRVAPQPEDMHTWIGFRQGKIAMVFEGVYMMQSLLRQKDIEFGAAPVPVLGDRPGTHVDSHNLCLRNGLNGRELDATWRFVMFLSDHSLEWCTGGQVPVRRDLRDSPAFDEQPVQKQFARQMPYLNYAPPVPFYTDFGDELAHAVDQSLRHVHKTPADTLAEAAAKVDTIIDRDRRMYPDSVEGAP